MVWTFTVERFEGFWAVLETEDGETFEFPKVFLPEGCQEGSFIDFNLSLNKEAELNAREAIRKLHDSLENNRES